MRILLYIFILSIFVLTNLNGITIVIPKTSNDASRDNYQIGLLKLVLDKAGEPYTITKTKKLYSQDSVVEALSKDDKINLYWMGTSKELEEKLLPIRVPLTFGMLGYRVFIIHKDLQDTFSKVLSLDDLRKLRGAQGIGWSDNKILGHSGLNQYQDSYETIFKIVNEGNKIDYFSRGLNEAFVEVKSRKAALQNLIVEKNVLLVYPFSMFFFVNPSNFYQ
ncbi:MAG: hypothetical protein HRT43_01920, partial [Campylobacteraceae bacterium]|nr:hypothetical protein [Campylobacteraceae bacterium]